MSYIKDNFLLTNKTAEKLYFTYAKDMPIFDYHCHLPEKQILENKPFEDVFQIWLAGDHYKWRLMRACGVAEEKITGEASWQEKFMAFASIMPRIIGNPVYAWVHLELKTYFGIVKPLNEQSALAIWEKANAKMKDGSFSARKLIVRSQVEALCTTDDPADSLEYHKNIAKDDAFFVKVLPTFRPDMACTGVGRDGFREYVEKIQRATGISCHDLNSFLQALVMRLDFFVTNGCRVSDISLARLSETTATYEQAKVVFEKGIQGEIITRQEEMAYCDYMLAYFAEEYQKRNMVMQLHFSAIRDNNTIRFETLGADCGNDSVGPVISVTALGRFLDELEKKDRLPKTIIYTLNESQYYELATMLGNFWGKGIVGRLQLGAAWWFCDHVEGIKNQLKITSATGALGVFNGMLTDSRSFTSYPRHDYFRRILCSYIANLVDNGEYDPDPKGLQKLIVDICIDNARKYF